jgi:hydroxymethylpyrimidine/phosphomethylpyrimidine kinase
MLAGNETPAVAMTISASDSGGGTGIQADLKTFAAHGVYGTSVLTAVAARNTEAMLEVEILNAELVGRQMDAVIVDMGVDAAKTGMLSSSDIIAAVARKLEEHHVEKVVVDPILVAKSGGRRLDSSEVQVLKAELLPRAYVVTPNLPEAEALVGFPVDDEDAIRGAARQIVELGAKAVVITGGHAKGEESVDWLYDGRRFSRFAAPRIATPNRYGAGCTFSAAITAQLARGAQLEVAVRSAKRYITAALERGFALGRGNGPVDPFVGDTVWPPRS